MASLVLKATTQSTIIRKLASYDRINEIQAALVEYNNIVMSDRVLNYTSSTSCRNNIQTAINRGEGYHRLRKNVAYAHDGKFQVHSSVDHLQDYPDQYTYRFNRVVTWTGPYSAIC